MYPKDLFGFVAQLSQTKVKDESGAAGGERGSVSAAKAAIGTEEQVKAFCKKYVK